MRVIELATPEIGFLHFCRLVCESTLVCGQSLFVNQLSQSGRYRISDGSSHHTLSNPALPRDKAILIGWVQVSDPLVHTPALTSFLKRGLTEQFFKKFLKTETTCWQVGRPHSILLRRTRSAPSFQQPWSDSSQCLQLDWLLNIGEWTMTIWLANKQSF